MAVQKDKRPALRYLLSADARLKKLSLKKLSQRQKKTAAPRRAPRATAKPERAHESLQWPWTANSRTMSLSLVGVIAAASLMAAGQMSQRTGSIAPDARIAGVASMAPPVVSTAAPPVVSAAPVTKPAPVEKPAPAAKPRTTEAVKTPAIKPTPLTPAAASPTAPVPESVSITGCLASSKNGYWLKDATGGELSKSRSWKTGFFKKRSPRVDVVVPKGLALAEHVGFRVTASGVLEDQELRARSVRRAGGACQ